MDIYDEGIMKFYWCGIKKNIAWGKSKVNTVVVDP